MPATIGVLDGAIRVGLTEDELGRFGPDARKVGPRDLAAAAVQGASVPPTVVACHAAGIRFMGAELQRKREGRKTRTGMSEDELEKMASKPDSKKKSEG